MGRVYSIVTCNERSDEAAEAWIKEGICAVGWYDGIDLQGVKTKEQLVQKLKKNGIRKPNTKSVNEVLHFLEINKGDVVIAYQRNNTIAAVGEVISDYHFNVTNSVGSPDGFNYQHQKKVKWLDHPREFSRHELPSPIAGRVTLRGKTTLEIKTQYNALQFLKMVRGLMVSEHEGCFNEDMVKAGLSKYVKIYSNDMETGLKIIKEERHIDDENKPDFIAKDRTGKTVIIECKGNRVGSAAIEQILRYKRSYGKNARYFLIGFTFDRRAIEQARKENIVVYEVDLKFKRMA
ncbi:MAG: hypothetical protein NT157_00095 [Candidatus Micrarchaeota archaeon]|nr:hypothetical protein [Candidatus Micrarchaeota archaeon]